MSQDIEDSVPYRLGRIETKIDALLMNHSDHGEQLESHGKRLKSLEKTKTWAIGVVAGIAFLVSYAKEWLPK